MCPITVLVIQTFSFRLYVFSLVSDFTFSPQVFFFVVGFWGFLKKYKYKYMQYKTASEIQLWYIFLIFNEDLFII